MKCNLFRRYVSAVRNTQYMGARLANFVQFLDRAGVPASSLQVVGFSLGAEAAGLAGKALRARGLRIGRITGGNLGSEILQRYKICTYLVSICSN